MGKEISIMSEHLIVVVNRSLARFFTLEPVEFPELESGPRITLRTELENQELKDGQEIFSDSKTGRGVAPRGGNVHGYDDKRDQHLDELRRRFAVTVFDQIQKIAKAEHSRTIILAVSARMRRFLYPHTDTLDRKGYVIHKISKNIINFSPENIHAYLAEDGIVPMKKRK
ncbi:hypothetical protein B2D07_14660 [Desulfococcus multivorans]|nr:hypothetical protein B2D07_14660 [Desulfococcus multivorans]